MWYIQANYVNEQGRVGCMAFEEYNLKQVLIQLSLRELDSTCKGIGKKRKDRNVMFCIIKIIIHASITRCFECFKDWKI